MKVLLVSTLLFAGGVEKLVDSPLLDLPEGIKYVGQLVAVSSRRVDQRDLAEDALSHSQRWIKRTLRKPPASLEMVGREGDGHQVLFTGGWRQLGGQVFWSDNGASATVWFRPSQEVSLGDVESAQAFVKRALTEFLRLEPLSNDSTNIILAERFRGTSAFSGTWLRSRTERSSIPGGPSTLTILDRSWQSLIRFVTDGEDLIVQVDFAEDPPPLQRKMSLRDARFKRGSG